MSARLRESYIKAYTQLRAQPNHPFARNLREFIHAIERVYPQETAKCCVSRTISQPAH